MTTHEYKVLSNALDDLKENIINSFDQAIADLKGYCLKCKSTNCMCYENHQEIK